MSLIGTKRLQQAMFEVAASQNRAYGSGGGSSLRAHIQLGTGNATTQNFNALAYADVVGTDTTFLVSRTCDIRLEAAITVKITAGANNGKLRFNAGSLGTTGDGFFGAPYFVAQNGFFDINNVAPGSYTAKIEAAVDNLATTLQVLSATLVVSQWF